VSFDSKLLDTLAMTFVEAAIRELETQALADTGVSSATTNCQCEHRSGMQLERASNTKFRVTDHNQGPGSEHAAIIGVVCPLQRTT